MHIPTKHVDASRFQHKLETLAETVVRRLQDEGPSQLQEVPFAQYFFVFSLRFCFYAYQTECDMYSDERRADSRWTWAKLIALPPMNRAVLDSLFNVIFVLENIEERMRWYLQSGLQEMILEHDRFLQQYAGDNVWDDWLKRSAELIQDGLSLSGHEKAKADGSMKAPKWPSSGQIPDYGTNPGKRPPNREFLQYLLDWFYREYSGVVHMSFFGMLRLGPVLLAPDLSKDELVILSKDVLPRAMTSHIVRSAILLLSLISELQNHFRFSGNLELRILEVWHVLIPDFLEAQEIFDKRYRALFPAVLLSL